VELLGCYTCQGSHNLLFQPASGDLQKLLDSPEPPEEFQTDADYVVGLHGLSSALETLHNYNLGSVDVDDVQFIGCHRDLKPRNILVEQGKLLLADFGLSALKAVSDDSKSIFTAGPGWYMAPECEDAENEYKPGRIGRASDIWSFGAIICELVTYMMHGSEGVSEFEERRTVSLGSIKTKTFHAGQSPHSGVQTWLEELEKSASATTTRLLQLARRMLAINPTERPNARTVMLHLRQLALTSKFLETRKLYEVYTKESKSLELTVEWQRFSLWGMALGISDNIASDEIHDREIIEGETIFERNMQSLSNIASKLDAPDQVEDHSHSMSLRLRILNDAMANTLPLSLQKSIERELELRMVEGKDLNLLKELKQTFHASSANESIGVLAAVRHMIAHCNAPPDDIGRALHLQGIILRNRRLFKGYELASMVKDDEDQRQVLVETIDYSESSSQSDACKELFDRVEAIANLLHIVSQRPAFKVLRCLGYYHEPRKHAFALIFEPPTAIYEDHGSTNPMSLEQMITQTQEGGPQRPALDERLKLAHSLTATVSEIHRADWQHKNISSSRVLFFIPQPQAVSESVPSPYLIGFNHSRHDDNGAFGAKPDTDELHYRHPDYSHPQSKHQPKHDYFSLGIVLLEIGLWKNVRNMLQLQGKERLEPQDILEPLMKEWIPQLGFYVGKKYQDAVTTCLTGNCEIEGQREPDDSRAKRPLSFETKVVEQLQSSIV